MNTTYLNIPEDVLEIVTLNGFKFLKGKGTNAFQCATCLRMMDIVNDGEAILGQVRKLNLKKSCDCPHS